MLNRRDLMKSAGLSVALGAVPVSLAARVDDLQGWVVLADPSRGESLSFAADREFAGIVRSGADERPRSGAPLRASLDHSFR